MIKRLTNDGLGRSYHDVLYRRFKAFCEKHNPGFPADAIANAWLLRLYSGDENLHILVNIDNHYQITEHAVIDVQEMYGQKVVHCYQVQHDNPDLAHTHIGMDYLDQLALATGAIGIMLIVQDHVELYQKRYNYTFQGTMLLKSHEVLHQQSQKVPQVAETNGLETLLSVSATEL